MKSVNNLFSSLQNGQKAKKHLISVPETKIVYNILDILLSEGYICGFSSIKSNHIESCLLDVGQHKSQIQVLLKYVDEEPAIKKIKQVSSSGCRVYINSRKIQSLPSVHFLILSTSKGIMTGKKARSLQIGGEIICRII